MFKYIILGITQGLTEFLPVSSSGHLAVLQKLLGISGHEIAVSVILHLGTLLAVFIFFFKDIMGLFCEMRKILLIFIVTLITGAIAIIGKDFFESLFSAPKLVAVGWIVTGIVLIFTSRFMSNNRDRVGIKDACALGFSQGLAIIPGLSRSGVTISTLLFRGLDRKTSFTFSFLAAIPAICAAALMEAKDISLALRLDPKSLMAGFICSFLAGLAALQILKFVINKARLYYFGYYCIVIAIITLIFMRS